MASAADLPFAAKKRSTVRKRKRVFEVGDPYAAGYDASVAGVGKAGNPHRAGSDQAEAWIAGWRSARSACC